MAIDSSITRDGEAMRPARHRFWVAVTAIGLLLPCGCRTGDAGQVREQKQGQVSVTKHASALQAIIQLVIDLPQLQPFLHPELRDRTPLVLIQTQEISPALGLKKFGQAVLIREMPAAQGKPFLHVTQLDVSGSKAIVRFQYPVEGVGGEVELKEKDGVWSVEKARVWER
jgi:hypothetical protein